MNIEKEKRAIERLQTFEPPEGYYLAYSGGKDSDCIKILAQLAGVKFEAAHNLTSVDAPETVRYIQSQKDVRIDKPHDKDGNRVTMWSLIVKVGLPPMRQMRYCCSWLKEQGGKDRLKVTGVRWAESISRRDNSGVVQIKSKPKTMQKAAEEAGVNYAAAPKGGLIMNDDNDKERRFVEHCYRTATTLINPIVDWTDEDVWDFLGHYGCKGNPLYSCGYGRVGCIGCPMTSVKNRYAEFKRYPKYKQMYIRAFDRMLEERKRQGKINHENWTSGEEVFKHWLDEDYNENQLTMFDMYDL